MIDTFVPKADGDNSKLFLRVEMNYCLDSVPSQSLNLSSPRASVYP